MSSVCLPVWEKEQDFCRGRGRKQHKTEQTEQSLDLHSSKGLATAFLDTELAERG